MDRAVSEDVSKLEEMTRPRETGFQLGEGVDATLRNTVLDNLHTQDPLARIQLDETSLELLEDTDVQLPDPFEEEIDVHEWRRRRQVDTAPGLALRALRPCQEVEVSSRDPREPELTNRRGFAAGRGHDREGTSDTAPGHEDAGPGHPGCLPLVFVEMPGHLAASFEVERPLHDLPGGREADVVESSAPAGGCMEGVELVQEQREHVEPSPPIRIGRSPVVTRRDLAVRNDRAGHRVSHGHDDRADVVLQLDLPEVDDLPVRGKDPLGATVHEGLGVLHRRRDPARKHVGYRESALSVRKGPLLSGRKASLGVVGLVQPEVGSRDRHELTVHPLHDLPSHSPLLFQPHRDVERLAGLHRAADHLTDALHGAHGAGGSHDHIARRNEAVLESPEGVGLLRLWEQGCCGQANRGARNRGHAVHVDDDSANGRELLKDDVMGPDLAGKRDLAPKYPRPMKRVVGLDRVGANG